MAVCSECGGSDGDVSGGMFKCASCGHLRRLGDQVPPALKPVVDLSPLELPYDPSASEPYSPARTEPPTTMAEPPPEPKKYQGATVEQWFSLVGTLLAFGLFWAYC